VCVRFAGYDWVVKKSDRFDPGGNKWDDEASTTVWVDADGLHLKLWKRVFPDGVTFWYCAEVMLNESLGYGKYSVDVASKTGTLDRNAVLGIFTYDYNDPAFSHRELDIEFSTQLGTGTYGHFTVQPYQPAYNNHGFNSSETGTHSIEWRPDKIIFQSGGESWLYVPGVTPAGIPFGQVPVPGSEHFRLNLWLFDHRPPANDVQQEIVVSSFRFER
jgi:hypothetical protein